MERILIFGYYGFGNAGDEAILRAILTSLRNSIPKANIKVLSLDPVVTSNNHKIESGPLGDFRYLLDSLAESDLAVIGGGGMFHDYEGFDIGSLFTGKATGFASVVEFALSSYALTKPLAIFAAGVGPLTSENSQIAAKAIFSQAEIATVRDSWSRGVLTEFDPMFLGLPITSDPGYWIDVGNQNGIKLLGADVGYVPSKPIIGVVVRNWKNNEWLDPVAKALRRFVVDVNGEILLIPFQRTNLLPNDDLGINIELGSRLGENVPFFIVDQYYSPQKLASIISGCNYILGMRLHACAFGLRFGLPTIGLAYDPKIMGLMADIGFPSRGIKLSNINEDLLYEGLNNASTSSSRMQGNYLNSANWLPWDLPARLIKEIADLNVKNSRHPLMESFLDIVLTDYPSVAERFSRIKELGSKVHSFSIDKRLMDEENQIDLASTISSFQQYSHTQSENVLHKSDEPSMVDGVVSELFEIVSEHASCSACVIIGPVVPWDYMFQRPQQIAKAFSELGYLVFYLQPELPETRAHFLKIQDGLYLSNAPVEAFVPIESPIIYVGSALLREFADICQVTFNAPFLIYDFLDDLSVSKANFQDHYHLLKVSDLVLATSTRLQIEARLYRDDTLYVPNAVDANRFETARNKFDSRTDPHKDSPQWKREFDPGRRIVGYAGALAEWFDYELLKRVANLHEEIEFVLVGIDYDGSLSRSEILSVDNITWLGHQEHESLIVTLFQFDVGIIPFKINDITKATSPIKLFEYFACGLPVVSTPLPELEGITEVFLAMDVESFANSIKVALEFSRDREFQSQLINIANENSWIERVKRIEIGGGLLEKKHQGLNSDILHYVYSQYLESNTMLEDSRKIRESLLVELRDRDEQIRMLASQIGSLEIQNQMSSRSLRNLERELSLIYDSRGWEVLKFSWRIVWKLRGGFRRVFRRFLKGSVRIRRIVSRLMPNSIRRVLFVAGPGRFIPKDNSEVVIYTSSENAFRNYQPRKKLSQQQTSRLMISLVVTVKNEVDSIKKWFASFKSQSRLPDEVIIVDGGSSDGTVEAIHEASAKSSLNFKIIESSNLNIAEGRNQAVGASSFPIIAFTDFGCRLTPHWLEYLIAPFEDDPEIEVVAGGYRPESQGWLASSFIYEVIPKLARIAPQSFLPSARSMAVKRVSWEKIGGDPEWLTLTGDDTYFDLELKRLARHWAFVPESIVDWQGPSTVKDFWLNLYNGASGDGESGVFSTRYVQNLLGLITLGIFAFVCQLVWSLVSFYSNWPLFAHFTPGFLAAVFMGVNFVFAVGRNQVPFVWRIIGQLARSRGFLHGVSRWPIVTARRFGNIRCVRVILAGVPFDDSGGGSRGAQLTTQWLEAGDLVFFVYRFPKDETVDLGIDMSHTNLFHMSIVDFDWGVISWAFNKVLERNSLTVVVEFPMREFLPAIRDLQDSGARVIYELIDDWNTSLGGEWFSLDDERHIFNLADHLTATAPELQRQLEKRSEREVSLIPNGVNLALFDRSIKYPRPSDMPRGESIGIYIGALWGEWFDWDLLIGLCERMPETQFVMIGDYQGEYPSESPNLHFLGLKPIDQLPAYLAHSDFALLPWKTGPITQSTSPIKVFEYLALSLPVIAPDLESLPQISWIKRSNGVDEFVAAIRKESGKRIKDIELDRFVREHSWSDIASKLDDL